VQLVAYLAGTPIQGGQVSREYETPTVSDYGELQELTASNNIPAFVDVPQGTIIGDPGNPSDGIIGDNLS
jgi:hypothetical protein